MLVSLLLCIAWFMLVKGNGGPANAFPFTLTLVCAFDELLPTLGTTESGGHTTFGDLNCTCAAANAEAAPPSVVAVAAVATTIGSAAEEDGAGAPAAAIGADEVGTMLLLLLPVVAAGDKNRDKPRFASGGCLLVLGPSCADVRRTISCGLPSPATAPGGAASRSDMTWSPST